MRRFELLRGRGTAGNLTWPELARRPGELRLG
jgi:hypothetical protein